MMKLRSKLDPSVLAVLAIVSVTLTAGHVTSPAVHASPPQSASGDFVVEELVPTSVEPKGENCHIELTATFNLEGTFEGSFVADFLIVHLGGCGEPAEERFVAEGTFTGEVEGASGSFDFVFVGDIDAEGFAEGDLVIGRSTGELAGLSGRITLSGLAGVEGAYEGRIHFAP